MLPAKCRKKLPRYPVPVALPETQVIHLALRDLAIKFLPQYEADEGALTKAQLNQVRKSVPKANGGTVRSSLFELENA